ncbi:sensor histidine kinase [Protaetiibacter sp. SSC-01]|nr:sensor histidine kinase [Protaetiibacter sp. SSC-01]
MATWWYTLAAVLAFELLMVFVWAAAAIDRGPLTAAAVGVAGLVWCASTVPLLVAYRHRTDQLPGEGRARVLVCLGVALLAGAAGGWLSGSWLVTAATVLQSVVLLNWPPGLRLRVVIGVVAVLLVVWLVVEDPVATDGWLPGLYATLLPVVTVSSLWWWDVLITLDRARATEARYAASQERLRVATDVHDLQGHHLQVIALQLELADRLRDSDPEASAEHLRAARASVDAARQGTRDLATRFRSVPLRDELANAVDLLRAAGATAQVSIGADADEAPADVLGPVIRETTTNVLRHGGGRWARLSLDRSGAQWRYEIANDVGAAVPGDGSGSGLDGIRRRAEQAGGSLAVERADDAFTVVVTVPAGAA